MLGHMVTEFRETSGASQAEAVATSGTPPQAKISSLGCRFSRAVTPVSTQSRMTRAHVLTDNEPDVQPHFLLRDALYRSSLCVLFSNPLCGACAGSISFVQYGVHNTSSAVLGLTNLNFISRSRRILTILHAVMPLQVYTDPDRSQPQAHTETQMSVCTCMCLYTVEALPFHAYERGYTWIQADR